MKKVMTLLLFTLVTATAFAQSDSPPPSFAALDTDADGRISKAEAKVDSRVANVFATLDKNQDGYLSPAEFAAMQ
ncbi:MAG: hypothetical protein AAGC71_16595 [Pseudomonadota bacterium]